ncbi:hypothetical protein ACEV8V_25185, partial [Vibrio parahaemolyticus]
MAEAKPYVDAAREGGAALPGSAYSTADKREIVQKGLNEPLLFRIIESEYNEDDGFIGYKPEGVTKLKYWTTTFTQA